MALINCSDCGNEHSDMATECPKCKRPNTKVKTEGYAAKLVAGIVAALVLGGFEVNPFFVIGGAIILTPIVMLIEKTSKPNPVLRGLVYGSIPIAGIRIYELYQEYFPLGL